MQDNLQRMVSINYILQSEILYNRKVKSLKIIFILGIKKCSSGQILFMFFYRLSTSVYVFSTKLVFVINCIFS